MNTLFQKLTAAIGLFLSFGLLSCQENSLVTPDRPTAVASQAVSSDISPTIPKIYKLTKCGEANLTYYLDGRLKRVMYGPDVRGSQAYRRDYTYSAGVINVSVSSGTDMLGQETYWVDANTGRCHESKVLVYLYSNSTKANVTERVYQYTDKGQLKTCTDKHSPGERTEYAYDVNSNLSKATRYGVPQFGYPVKVLEETTFMYDQPAGDPILADLYPLNALSTGLPDEYLQIFGKPGKHLVKLTTQKFSLGGTYYTYTLNADGYVTTRQKYDLSGGGLVETKPYDYQVTTIGFNL